MGEQGGFGSLLAVGALQERSGLFQHHIPHCQFQSLVGCTVRIGHHMEPQHLICQSGLTGRGPYAGQQGEAKGQKQGSLPKPQLG